MPTFKEHLIEGKEIKGSYTIDFNKGSLASHSNLAISAINSYLRVSIKVPTRYEEDERKIYYDKKMSKAQLLQIQGFSDGLSLADYGGN